MDKLRRPNILGILTRPVMVCLYNGLSSFVLDNYDMIMSSGNGLSQFWLKVKSEHPEISKFLVKQFVKEMGKV